MKLDWNHLTRYIGVPLDLVWEEMSIKDKAPLIEEIARVLAVRCGF